MKDGVSFLIPVHGVAESLEGVLRAVAAQKSEVETEILLIDDGARESAREILEAWSKKEGVRLLEGERRGASAALNTGVRAARHRWIAQVDQDVILHDGWLGNLLERTDDQSLGAVQGYWVTDRKASIWSRIAGLDLEERYSRLREGETNHVCTGQTLYRKQALLEVGLFDESLGYGYDNDMSYRLQKAGYRLALCRSAESRHVWPESPIGYFEQQYGQGYGRLDLIAKHPARFSGDQISDWRMILHVPVLMVAIAALATGLFASISGRHAPFAYFLFALALAVLGSERLIAGFGSWRRQRDWAALLFVPLHLLRDLAWILALFTWTLRRLAGRSAEPKHSMSEKRKSSARATRRNSD